MSVLNKILCLLVSLCMGQIAAAQGGVGEARQLLDRVSDTFRQAGGVEIVFEIRAPEGTSAGRIRLKGDKFRLDTEGVTTWFDGQTQWTYLDASDEVNVSEPTAEELQSINPYAWLSLYKNGYTLKMGKQADPRLHKVVMTASRRGSELQCLILYIDKQTLHPAKLSLVRRGDREAVIVLVKAYRTGQAYDDTLFTFDKHTYPTAEVIDLR